MNQNGDQAMDNKLYINLNFLIMNNKEGTLTYIYFFVSFLHIDTTQVVKILPQIRQDHTNSI